MDWGVVADANQEVWLGDGLKVARGRLLAYQCGCFLCCFFFDWVKCFNSFLLVHAHACSCKISITKNGTIFIFYFFFSNMK